MSCQEHKHVGGLNEGSVFVMYVTCKYVYIRHTQRIDVCIYIQLGICMCSGPRAKSVFISDAASPAVHVHVINDIPDRD